MHATAVPTASQTLKSPMRDATASFGPIGKYLSGHADTSVGSHGKSHACTSTTAADKCLVLGVHPKTPRALGYTRRARGPIGWRLACNVDTAYGPTGTRTQRGHASLTDVASRARRRAGGRGQPVRDSRTTLFPLTCRGHSLQCATPQPHLLCEPNRETPKRKKRRAPNKKNSNLARGMERDRSDGDEGELCVEFCTYHEGPSLSTTRPITTHTILGIIQSLKELFGDEYDFEPEAISEGGILWTRYPGKEGKAWKTLRLRIDTGAKRWPWIVPGTLQLWRVGGPETIWPLDPAKEKRRASLKGSTFLKAFLGAPCWTTEEVAKFCKAFKANGIKCSNLPEAFELKENGRKRARY